jgi:NAD(P)-dependent dehydrogenase (short-subunit alcohol dehydrogenase family)
VAAPVQEPAPRCGRLDGRVAVVTGAGQGVGRGIALALATEGANQAVVDRDLNRATETADTCTTRGVDAVAVRCDVSDETAVHRAVAATHERFGRIDILVNNAHDFTVGVRLEDTTPELMQRSWSTAALGTLFFMQACLPYMREHGGKILNVGSGAGLDGDVGSASYVAAKEAVRALTRVAAREWGPYGIYVNTLCPFASSPRWEAFAREHPGRVERQAQALPLRRAPGDPELDIGRAALFLVSDDSSYVTGQTLFVEGGRMRT